MRRCGSLGAKAFCAALFCVLVPSGLQAGSDDMVGRFPREARDLRELTGVVKKRSERPTFGPVVEEHTVGDARFASVLIDTGSGAYIVYVGVYKLHHGAWRRLDVIQPLSGSTGVTFRVENNTSLVAFATTGRRLKSYR